jgi:hypothetical protein
MANIKQLSDASPDGVQLGQSTTDKVGFFGVTPAVRGTNIATAIATTAITPAFTTTVTGTFGFVTSAQGTAVLAAVASLVTGQENILATVNTIRANLVALGIQKGS